MCEGAWRGPRPLACVVRGVCECLRCAVAVGRGDGSGGVLLVRARRGGVTPVEERERALDGVTVPVGRVSNW